VDGFEPVGFALAVVTVDYVQAWSPKDFAAKISKIIYFESVKDHPKILAYDFRSDAVLDAFPKTEALFLVNKNERFHVDTNNNYTPLERFRDASALQRTCIHTHHLLLVEAELESSRL